MKRKMSYFQPTLDVEEIFIEQGIAQTSTSSKLYIKEMEETTFGSKEVDAD